MTSTRIRLVALDLDGTLVGKDLTISPRVRASIAAARERGAEITIVTGRMFAAARPFAQTPGRSSVIRVLRSTQPVRRRFCARRRCRAM
jgi:hydroxymethylpyrimidine pyrophosphatase-like HAD family hydrolase